MTSLLVGLLLLATPDGGWTAEDGKPFPEATAAALSAVVNEARSVGPFAGLSVAVLHGDQLWLEATGAATARPFTAATTDTSFRIASVTKTFTAALALQLRDEGRLDLDADVRALVPEFPEKKGVVTARGLLGHTSGVGHYRNLRDGRTTRPTTTVQALELFKARPLVFEPGSAFLYSSYGYVLLGAEEERAAGMSFGELATSRLLAPLGLEATGLEASPRTAAHRATGYSAGTRSLVPSRPLDISSRFASGGFRSNVKDLITWGRALLDGRVVKQETWAEMTTPASTTSGIDPDYGYGFAVYPLRGRKVVAHAGGQPGASALLMLVPEERFAIVILSNVSGRAAALTRLSNHLLEVVLDGGAPRRSLWSSSFADEVRFDLTARVMSHGLMNFAPGAPADDAAVAAAFAWANQRWSDAQLAEDPQLAQDDFRKAYQRAAGRRSVLLGVEMARLLAERRGANALSTYSQRGSLAFFADYVSACAKKACPHPIEKAAAAHFARLSAAWDATPPALLAARAETISQSDDVAALLAPLNGQPAHPNFIDDLTREAARARLAGKPKRAAELVELSERLHPGAPLALLALAEDAAARGDAAVASQRLGTLFEHPHGARLFNPEFVKDRSETMRFGATAAAAKGLDALYAEARARAKVAALEEEP